MDQKTGDFYIKIKETQSFFNFGQHFEQPTSIYGCLIEQTPA